MFSFFKKKSSEPKKQPVMPPVEAAQPAADSHDPADAAYLKEPIAALKDHRREVFDAVGRIKCAGDETKILNNIPPLRRPSQIPTTLLQSSRSSLRWKSSCLPTKSSATTSKTHRGRSTILSKNGNGIRR